MPGSRRRYSILAYVFFANCQGRVEIPILQSLTAPPTSFPAAHLYKKGSDAPVASLICNPCSKPHAKMLCSSQFIRPHHPPPRHPSARRIFDEPEVRPPQVYRRGEAGGGRKGAGADMPAVEGRGPRWTCRRRKEGCRGGHAKDTRTASGKASLILPNTPS